MLKTNCFYLNDLIHFILSLSISNKLFLVVHYETLGLLTRAVKFPYVCIRSEKYAWLDGESLGTLDGGEVGVDINNGIFCSSLESFL